MIVKIPSSEFNVVYRQKKEKFEFYKLFLSKYYVEYIETAYFNNISEVFFLISLQLIKLSAQFLVAQQSRSGLDEGHVTVASRVSQKNTDPRATRHPSPVKEYHVSR